jgi:acetyl/propionyl-CoA carboxylase alpha subunit
LTALYRVRFSFENAEFVRKCEKANLVFIGPTAESMEGMGSKIGAKNLLRKCAPEVPLIPGSSKSNISPYM